MKSLKRNWKGMKTMNSPMAAATEQEAKAREIQKQLPLMFEIANYSFNMAFLVDIDRTRYQPGADRREITLRFVDDIEHVFADERADACEYWYLQLTGQAKVSG